MKTIAVLVLLGSITGTAAGTEDLAPGTRVRVTRKGAAATHTGSLVEMDSARLVVRLAEGDTVRVPLSDLERIEVSRRASRRGRGALLGAAIGGLVGFVAGVTTNSGGCDASGGNVCLFGPGPLFSDTESGAMAAVPGALLGALAGALAGGERWRPVEDGRVQVGLSAPRRGGLALAVRF